ncbi:MAG: hypothetical protein QF781_10100 [Phycisphaerales bacterium]|jgi:hypothetical protein|nr:hypothetical protein [Phycisphaerales bacterium]MDP6312488.1 hypothetical protein [Phycisphaerales bacterium]MDP7086280.1 hypothetical protein [Phycisphaerales bacterium]MDP7188389.1 hypothetical protein [Phycisphaerales bacterium]MDP7518598.1 hypothetical protein [Phycisphaerales bacterium]|tara:strand:+ start:75 stop:767 length:693 start_codon:yes stop_codon:yes gene_type:complete
MSPHHTTLPALLAMSCLTSFASAGSTSWSFDVSTGGEDVFWTSSTTVATDATDYEYVYDITYIAADVVFMGIVFGPFDVTSSIDPEMRHGEGSNPGPLPIVIGDSYISADADDDGTIDVEAHLYMEISGSGNGFISLTDIFLGDVVYDMGWPFGEQNVQIDRVYLQGTMVVTPVYNDCLGDINGDDTVNVNDLLQLIGDWDGSGDSDIDGDGVVGVNDLLELLAVWGPCA